MNFYDYGARNYDLAIGRWMNINPFSDSYEINVADNPFNWFKNSAGHSYHQDYRPQKQMLEIITNAFNQLNGQ